MLKIILTKLNKYRYYILGVPLTLAGIALIGEIWYLCLTIKEPLVQAPILDFVGKVFIALSGTIAVIAVVGTFWYGVKINQEPRKSLIL